MNNWSYEHRVNSFNDLGRPFTLQSRSITSPQLSIGKSDKKEGQSGPLLAATEGQSGLAL